MQLWTHIIRVCPRALKSVEPTLLGGEGEAWIDLGGSKKRGQEGDGFAWRRPRKEEV
jgi:hypothetical protein